MDNRYYQFSNNNQRDLYQRRPSHNHRNELYHQSRYEHETHRGSNRNDGYRNNSRERISHYSPKKRKVDNYYDDDRSGHTSSDHKNHKPKDSIYVWALHFNGRNENSNSWPERPFSNYKLTETDKKNECYKDCDKVKLTNNVIATESTLFAGDVINLVDSDEDSNEFELISNESEGVNSDAEVENIKNVNMEKDGGEENNESDAGDLENISMSSDDEETIKTANMNDSKQSDSKSWVMESSKIRDITFSIRRKFRRIKPNQVDWSKLFDGTYHFKVEVQNLPKTFSVNDVTQHFHDVRLTKVELAKSPIMPKTLIAFIYTENNEDFKKCFSYHLTKTKPQSNEGQENEIKVLFPIHDEKLVGYEKLRRNFILEKLRNKKSQGKKTNSAHRRKMKRKAAKIKIKEDTLAYGHPL